MVFGAAGHGSRLLLGVAFGHATLGTMVNKGSFFQRLKGRWGSGSGVRVESSSSTSSRANTVSASATRAQQSAATASRIDSELAQPRDGSGRSVSSAFHPAETRSSRKMSDREEAMLAVGQHFQELTALMRGSQAASDEKLQKIVDATSSIPVLGQQQLEALQSLSQQMQKQNELGEKLSTTMTRLPNLLENVEKALDRAATTDERTAATVMEFQSTMDRIHTSMDKMVEHSGDQAKATQELASRRSEELKGLASDIAKAQDGAVDELKRTTGEGLKGLRRTHEDQSNRLQKVVEEQAGWNRAVLVGIGLVVLGIGAVIALQLMK
jgi:uncharacterized protein YukE/uncharacterized coiled-coil protein SlyX